MPTKLLLADDSATIQRVIGLTFAGLDVEVIVAGDGDEAIARIEVERPDIVLADIGMPKRSGYDVSAFVKNHPELGRIPVVLLAGAFEPVDDVRAREARCDGVLVKPLEPQQVISTVHDLIGRANAASPRAVQTVSKAGQSDVALADPFQVDRADRMEPDRMTETPVASEDTTPKTATGTSGPLLEDLLSSTPLPDLGLVVAPFPVDAPSASARSAPPTNGQDVSAEPASGAVEGSKRSVVAQAFSAILAAENGERLVAAPLRFGSIGVSPVVTEAMVNDLVRRVVERLSEGSSEHVGSLVRRVVSDVAERLVREEIDRLLH